MIHDILVWLRNGSFPAEMKRKENSCVPVAMQYGRLFLQFPQYRSLSGTSLLKTDFNIKYFRYLKKREPIPS